MKVRTGLWSAFYNSSVARGLQETDTTTDINKRPLVPTRARGVEGHELHEITAVWPPPKAADRPKTRPWICLRSCTTQEVPLHFQGFPMGPYNGPLRLCSMGRCFVDGM